MAVYTHGFHESVLRSHRSRTAENSAAYLLPELRKNWPAWKPLVKDGKSNYIGPASVPMMALLHQRALLNSALVRSAEAWLDSAEQS